MNPVDGDPEIQLQLQGGYIRDYIIKAVTFT